VSMELLKILGGDILLVPGDVGGFLVCHVLMLLAS